MNIKEIAITSNLRKKIQKAVKNTSIIFEDENGDIVVNVTAYTENTAHTGRFPLEDILGEDALDKKLTNDTDDVENLISNDTVDEDEVIVTTQEPLPSEEDLDDMLSEIRELEQDDIEADLPEDNSASKEELQAILSSIPSFSDTKKKKPE